MDINQIQILLAKYFDGNTSIEEENELLLYFNLEKQLSEELLPYKKQFELIFTCRKLDFDQAALENKILRSIDSIENSKHLNYRKFNIGKWVAAASIMIIVGLGVIIYYINNDKLQDTYSDPKLAYIETQNALLYVSEKMNKGIEPLSNISKINSGTSQLKNLEIIDESLGMLHLVSFLNNSSNLKK